VDHLAGCGPRRPQHDRQHPGLPRLYGLLAARVIIIVVTGWGQFRPPGLLRGRPSSSRTAGRGGCLRACRPTPCAPQRSAWTYRLPEEGRKARGPLFGQPSAMGARPMAPGAGAGRRVVAALQTRRGVASLSAISGTAISPGSRSTSSNRPPKRAGGGSSGYGG
jgi:hypothetical protein